MKLKIPNWESLCNPNLLTNSDFRSGIINQKGQTSYTFLGGYTIDMWISSGGTITVGDGYIDIENNTDVDTFFTQKIDILPTDNYTLAVYVENLVGTVNARIQGANDYDELKLINGLNVLNSERDITDVHLKIFTGSSLRLRYMKLEKGQYFTGMPVWDRPVEVMKCRRYFRNLNGSKDETIFIGVTDQNGVITFPISTYDMAKTPSVSLKNIWAVADDSIYQEVSVSSTSTRNTILLLTKIPNKTVRLYYSSNDNYFYIDAYNYG